MFGSSSVFRGFKCLLQVPVRMGARGASVLQLHKFVDRSYPATPASYAMPCVESLVAADADVVVVEYTMNENRTAEFDSLERREYEQLLRRVLRLPGQPAVVLLHSYAWLLAAGDGVTEGLFYTNTEGQLATLAQFYDVPSLSLRAAVWQLMQAGIDGFKVDKVSGQAFTSHLTGRTVPAAAKREADGYFYMDGAHPTAAGHLAMAELLAGLFSRAVLDATSGLALHSRTDDRLTVLPPAMIPNNPDQPTAFCAMMEEFQHVVKAHAGFEYKALNPNAAGFAAQKWGWLATRPGMVKKQVSQHAKCRMQFKVILAPNKQADEEQRVLLVAVSVIHRA
ncbi:hypothetical protein ACK3TF_004888 [Chlorella vulgaris]